jgi:hypothetical protein
MRAILRLPATCICGSDLWPYRGADPVDRPSPMGHEYAGLVEEVGSAVTTIRPGQFVVGSFFVDPGSGHLSEQEETSLYRVHGHAGMARSGSAEDGRRERDRLPRDVPSTVCSSLIAGLTSSRLREEIAFLDGIESLRPDRSADRFPAQREETAAPSDLCGGSRTVNPFTEPADGRQESHNTCIDDSAAATGACGQLHTPTGRICTLKHHHEGSCQFDAPDPAESPSVPPIDRRRDAGRRRDRRG